MTTRDALRGTSLSDLVAEEIRAMMARRRMTGAELAKRLGVSPAWVSYRLTCQRAIDLNDLQRIADALAVEPRELLPRPSALPPAHAVRYQKRAPAGPRRPRRLCPVLPIAA